MSPCLNMQVQGDVTLEPGISCQWTSLGPHVEAESGLGFEKHQTWLFSLWLARKPFKSNIPYKKIRGTMIHHCI